MQERSVATVAAIFEAAIQVLLCSGLDRLTTTRVAARAGVSVGSLYQYYPNKQALLFAVLEHHLTQLADSVERACAARHHCLAQEMVEALVEAFVRAKLDRPDVSKALYRISSELDGAAIVERVMQRARAAVAAMLATAPAMAYEDLTFTTMMLFSAMAGATRAVLESGATPRSVAMLQRELVVLCGGYLACFRMPATPPGAP